MNDPKPFASLSSGLLARKGAAKPAMRPQGFGQMGFGLEDLGWNDMGGGQGPAEARPISEDERPEHVPSSISALTPSPKSEAPADESLAAAPLSAEGLAEENLAEGDEAEEFADFPPPPVVEQQRAIEASFADPSVDARMPAAIVKLPPRPRQERGTKSKAAFTLRLDMDRHLKLRLACAVTHRSAQQIVTRALDDYLASLPELDSMASQVPAKVGKRS
jgi:hypothetical protein